MTATAIIMNTAILQGLRAGLKRGVVGPAKRSSLYLPHSRLTAAAAARPFPLPSIAPFSTSTRFQIAPTTAIMATKYTPRDGDPVLPLFSLKGKTAIVSGAGAGIGLAVADAFAESGANVAIWYNSNTKAIERAQAIAEKWGVVCMSFFFFFFVCWRIPPPLPFPPLPSPPLSQKCTPHSGGGGKGLDLYHHYYYHHYHYHYLQRETTSADPPE